MSIEELMRMQEAEINRLREQNKRLRTFADKCENNHGTKLARIRLEEFGSDVWYLDDSLLIAEAKVALAAAELEGGQNG